jgi:hypothetical protein
VASGHDAGGLNSRFLILIGARRAHGIESPGNMVGVTEARARSLNEHGWRFSECARKVTSASHPTE